MNEGVKSFSIMQWIAGIIATVVSGLVIWFITERLGVQDLVTKDISGVWKTPMKDLSYKIIQDNNSYTWIIRESGVSGGGTIKGSKLISDVNGKEVVYQVKELASDDDRFVLYTHDPAYATVILFKECRDLEDFLKEIGYDSPALKKIVSYFMEKLPNPTCPDIKL